jgi:hypothetical protein
MRARSIPLITADLDGSVLHDDRFLPPMTDRRFFRDWDRAARSYLPKIAMA